MICSLGLHLLSLESIRIISHISSLLGVAVSYGPFGFVRWEFVRSSLLLVPGMAFVQMVCHVLDLIHMQPFLRLCVIHILALLLDLIRWAQVRHRTSGKSFAKF